MALRACSPGTLRLGPTAFRSTGGHDAAAEEPHHRDSRPGPAGDQQCFIESSRCRYGPHAPHAAATASARTRSTARLEDEEDAAPPRSATQGRQLARHPLAGAATFPSSPRHLDDGTPHTDPPAAVDLGELVLVAPGRRAHVAG